jgi:hypothetical protein
MVFLTLLRWAVHICLTAWCRRPQRRRRTLVKDRGESEETLGGEPKDQSMMRGELRAHCYEREWREITTSAGYGWAGYGLCYRQV